MPAFELGTHTSNNDMPAARRRQILEGLGLLADQIRVALAELGLPPHTSPLIRPRNLAIADTADGVYVLVAPSPGGIGSVLWLDRANTSLPLVAFAPAIRQQVGWRAEAVLVIPHAATVEGADASLVHDMAQSHARDVERGLALARLGDISGREYLEPYLRTFLEDHPDPARNVFIMMRFRETDQFQEIHDSIVSTLADRGLHGLRADDRDYTGDLWTNIEVYLLGSHLGIAVFEDIEEREFNPNVALELGYMMAMRRRCLLLKEQRLPSVPADVVHRLYKPFDAFSISESIRTQVLRWVDVDLGRGS